LRIELLKNFINENKELQKLENITDKFNIFRSLDIVSNELKHSNFLSWLLDPTGTHGLGNYFLTAFLKKYLFKYHFLKVIPHPYLNLHFYKTTI